MLNSAEKYINSFDGLANLGGITYNRLVSQQVDASRVEVNNRIKENIRDLKTLAAEKFPNREINFDTQEFTDLAEGRFDKLSDTQKQTLKNKEAKESREVNAKL